jgi:membrane-bound ClpP family serine protease
MDVRSPLRPSLCRRAGERLLLAGPWLIAATVWAAEAPPGPPAEQPLVALPAQARIIRVPLPITDNVDRQVWSAIERALENRPPGAQRPVLVLELAPHQAGADAERKGFGLGNDFFRALGLAKRLSALSAAKTVAFVPRTVKGHAVLVALACEELVMAPDAALGEAGADLQPGEPISAPMLAGYTEVAQARRTVPLPVALGMLDKSLEVVRVQTEVSTEYVLRDDLPKLKAQHTVQSEEVLVPAGTLGLFPGHQARELGFAKYLAADRAALAKALGLLPDQLEEDPSLGGSWRGVRVALRGPVTSQSAARAQKTIANALSAEQVNFVLLAISSPGGSLSDSLTLANYLAELDPARVRTVALVSEQALADAALVALACDHVLLEQGAVLGGDGAGNPLADELESARESIRNSLAKAKSRSWSTIVALLDPSLSVHRYTHRRQGHEAYFSAAELAEQPDPDDWIQAEEVTTPGAAFQVHGDQAVRLRLARQIVADSGEIRQLYGLESELTVAEPGWADFLIDALAAPQLQWLLVAIGMAALWAELHSPGVGFGGFIAGVSFLLFFWGSFLGGTANWLEVLLFLAGCLCVVLEIFVIPGVGIFGLGGGLMILVSLVLASQTFVWPHNSYQLTQLRNSLLGVAGAGVAMVAVASVMRRYLPQTPMLGRMVLLPPTDSELQSIAQREVLVDLQHLLGRHGQTTTQLTPSGKARFGAQLVDVTAEGEVVGRGTEVVVIAVAGNRVVVRPVA